MPRSVARAFAAYAPRGPDVGFLFISSIGGCGSGYATVTATVRFPRLCRCVCVHAQYSLAPPCEVTRTTASLTRSVMDPAEIKMQGDNADGYDDDVWVDDDFFK